MVKDSGGQGFMDLALMVLAAAVVVGASVILFDPIFQGLAIALMAGEATDRESVYGNESSRHYPRSWA